MKREQAVIILSRLLHVSKMPFTTEERQAIKVAIEALLQPTLTEAIPKKE